MSKSNQNTSALTSAIDDIRHTLLEEPWFGKEVTGNIETPEQSFESFYGAEPSYSPQQDINIEPDLEQDLDEDLEQGR